MAASTLSKRSNLNLIYTKKTTTITNKDRKHEFIIKQWEKASIEAKYKPLLHNEAFAGHRFWLRKAYTQQTKYDQSPSHKLSSSESEASNSFNFWAIS